MQEHNNYKYIKYNDFWQNSLQRLEGITKNLEQDFYKLEKKYYDFDKIYDEIITELDILASIYSSHNNLRGGEYILKLKALLKNYKKRYTHEGISFKTIHFLNSKINKLRDLSFKDFPEMEHAFSVYKDISNHIGDSGPDKDVQRYIALKSSAKYKWITFFRNSSWFITPYGRLHIIKQEEAEISGYRDNRIKLRFDKKSMPVIDIFSQFSSNRKEKIKFFFVTEYNNTFKCFAADKLDKIIMADKNFIIPRLVAIKNTKITSGRIRIFGKNHIYL